MTVVASIAAFDEAPGPIFLPASLLAPSQTSDADSAAELSQWQPPAFFDPELVLPERASWEQFRGVLIEMLRNLRREDVSDLLNVSFLASHTILTGGPDFARAFDEALNQYLIDQAKGLLEFVHLALTQLQHASACTPVIFGATAEELQRRIFDPDQSFDPEIILAQLVGSPECAYLEPVIRTLGAMRNAWESLGPNKASSVWESCGTYATILLDMMRNKELQEMVIYWAGDEVKLGRYYGSLVGFVFWEIIENALTSGAGKVMKAVRVAPR